MVDKLNKDFREKMKIGKLKGNLKKKLSCNEKTGQKELGEY